MSQSLSKPKVFIVQSQAQSHTAVIDNDEASSMHFTPGSALNITQSWVITIPYAYNYPRIISQKTRG